MRKRFVNESVYKQQPSIDTVNSVVVPNKVFSRLCNDSCTSVMATELVSLCCTGKTDDKSLIMCLWASTTALKYEAGSGDTLGGTLKITFTRINVLRYKLLGEYTRKMDI